MLQLLFLRHVQDLEAGLGFPEVLRVQAQMQEHFLQDFITNQTEVAVQYHVTLTTLEIIMEILALKIVIQNFVGHLRPYLLYLVLQVFHLR